MKQFFLDNLEIFIPILLAVLPAFYAWLTTLVRSAFEHMPSKQRQLIQSIVASGVAAVMQAHPELSNAEKKEQALQYMEQLLAHYHLKVGREVLEPLLEEAVLLVKIAAGESLVQRAMQAPKRDGK